MHHSIDLDPQLLWRVSYLEPSNFIFLFVTEFFDDLVGLALGLKVCGAAILLKPWVKRPIEIDKASSAVG